MTCPDYLTCPYCPAQAYPTGIEMLKYLECIVVKYVCPAKHHFYIEQEKANASVCQTT